MAAAAWLAPLAWGSWQAPRTTIVRRSEPTPAPGAQFGTSLLWTARVTFPMMFAVVYLSSQLGQATGRIILLTGDAA